MNEPLRGLWRFSADFSGSDSAQRLNQALSWLADQHLLPFVPVQKVVSARGKPAFADLPGLHFSISHCRQEAITRRFFHPREQAWLTQYPEAFFSLWTAKESVVKWSGKGIGEDFSRFSVIDEAGQLHDTPNYRLIPFVTKKGTPGTMCLSASLRDTVHDYFLD